MITRFEDSSGAATEGGSGSGREAELEQKERERGESEREREGGGVRVRMKRNGVGRHGREGAARREEVAEDGS